MDAPSLHLTFTRSDAGILLGVIQSLLIPFAVSYLKRADWPDGWKLALVVAFSLGGGALSVYAAGELVGPLSVVQAGALVLSAATASYHTWFKSLGFERVLNPETGAGDE